MLPGLGGILSGQQGYGPHGQQHGQQHGQHGGWGPQQGGTQHQGGQGVPAEEPSKPEIPFMPAQPPVAQNPQFNAKEVKQGGSQQQGNWGPHGGPGFGPHGGPGYDPHGGPGFGPHGGPGFDPHGGPGFGPHGGPGFGPHGMPGFPGFGPHGQWGQEKEKEHHGKDKHGGHHQNKQEKQQGDYPPQQGGYPPQQGGYPPQQGGYPPQQGGYPPQQGGYPPQQGGYPPQQGGYPPQQGGYPPQQGGYGYQQPESAHEHPLDYKDQLNENCKICMQNTPQAGYKCGQCPVVLCLNCANRIFYGNKKKSTHNHDLALKSRNSWKCNVCKKMYKGTASFYCKKCDFDACDKCYLDS